MGAVSPSQRADESCRFPVAMGDGSQKTFPLFCSATEPRHVGRRPGLIDEDQPLNIQAVLTFTPDSAAGRDVLALLFGGMARLFFSVKPSASNVAHMVAAQTFTPRSWATQAASSSSVASGFAFTRATSASR
jgi:hypothetical protein